MLTPAQIAWNRVALLKILDGAHKANNAPVDNFAVQKLSFVSELNGRSHNLQAAYYKFFRFTWGPYSSVLANDVRLLESIGLIDPESRQITERGRFLLGYIQTEIDESEAARLALDAISKTLEEWGGKRGWQIVNAVYELTVPVDERGGEKMKMKDIPLHTDIILPSIPGVQDVLPFSDQMLADIEAELAIPADHLDPESPELEASVRCSLEAVFSR
jgi:hypothetical protein